MGKQGETATNKDNNINIIKGLIYSGIPSNMAGYCKLMAQNWHKNFALMRACSGFFLQSIPQIKNLHNLSSISKAKTLLIRINFNTATVDCKVTYSKRCNFIYLR